MVNRGWRSSRLGRHRALYVAIARILGFVTGLVRKAGSIELHCHVRGDIGVGKVEDNSVSVGFIGAGGYVKDGLVVV